MSSWQEKIESKIIEPTSLSLCAERLREEKRTIATLNGAFDLLHPGHLYMISAAAAVANALIVLLNSDASIKAYKGEARPYCPLQQRLLMIAGLFEVTYVSWFDELDPCAILALIKPDVHVNGVEYGYECIEANVVRAYGGRIHLVDRIGNFATSNIIKKVCV